MRIILLAVAMLYPAAACAQDCPARAEPVPAELSAWARGADTMAAADAPTAPLIVNGRAAELALHPAAHLTEAATPGRPVRPDSHAGLVAFDIATAGTYRIALSNAAWVDVVADGAAIASIAHGHGPRCSGMR